MSPLPAESQLFELSDEVRDALRRNRPVVALETTIISHGMPYPRNLEVAGRGIETLASAGVVAAPIAILEGTLRVGLTTSELALLAQAPEVEKVSRRDIARVVALGRTGATTVSATMFIAAAAGIEVFATGGIGGVHRGARESFDVSADLIEFGRTRIVVVSAGAKAILDISATVEYLETQGVPVIGYGTDEFPAFYSRSSGVSVPARVDTAEEIAALYRRQTSLGLDQGILVANPINPDDEIPSVLIESCIDEAIGRMESEGIVGKAVTPFLLSQIVELTDGRALDANEALFYNNLRLAARISSSLAENS